MEENRNNISCCINYCFKESENKNTIEMGKDIEKMTMTELDEVWDALKHS